MDRKQFLASSSGAFLTLTTRRFIDDESPSIVPPYLRKFDTIGITAPSGYITRQEIMPSIRLLESWGFNVVIGDTIGKRDFTFGGTDAERAADLQRMLDDTHVRAILCARGGYGSIRIIDQLDWTRFTRHPKWIIGFSDATVIHSHLNRKLGIASLHSKMCNSFPDDWSRAEPIQVASIESIRDALTGKKVSYTIVPNASNRPGTATGILVGGNLKTIETLAGSASDLHTEGKILFVEDTGEYMYSIDRMFWNLKRSGKLAKLKGLIVGGFKVKVDEGDDDFGRTLEQTVLEKVKEYHYPVCFDFPVGHQKNNFAIKCGIKHTLVVQPSSCTLKEITS